MRSELGLDFEPEKLPNCTNRQVDDKLTLRPFRPGGRG